MGFGHGNTKNRSLSCCKTVQQTFINLITMRAASRTAIHDDCTADSKTSISSCSAMVHPGNPPELWHRWTSTLVAVCWRTGPLIPISWVRRVSMARRGNSSGPFYGHNNNRKSHFKCFYFFLLFYHQYIFNRTNLNMDK